MAKQNYLLGRGERLTEEITVKSGGGPKAAPYTFTEARQRLTPMLKAAVKSIEAIPDDACPDDQAIATVTLNPEYIAKSYYPQELFRVAGVTPVGSRPRKLTPQKRSKDRPPEEAVTTQFFVMGPRGAFREWSNSLPGWVEGTSVAKELITIEEIATPTVDQKIKGALPRRGKTTFEVVLHSDEIGGEQLMLPEFRKYVRGLGISSDFDKRFYAGGLCFLELEAPAELAEHIATFTAVRALREMPRLRMLRPTVRTIGLPSQAIVLPTQSAMDPALRVAIFDGGVPDDHAITSWTTPIEASGVGAPVPEFLQHGLGVTSAFLFGSLRPGVPAARPYANVDHYRVLDGDPGQKPRELYEVLDRIDRVLSDKRYDFINISLGPQLPIEDDDVHAWTAVLDDRLSRHDTLATVAVGNDGEGDKLLGLDRIQVPSDCVNALAVGACDTPDNDWQRAPYSSVGPGRSPGIVKPDLVDFGGSMIRPFLVLAEGDGNLLDATGGTSFAAPSLLRLGAGVRAHMGSNVGLLAVRALLIHTAEITDQHDRLEVGWGRAARDIQDVIVCDDDMIRVIYQGNISPAKYVRAPIPVPEDDFSGMVDIAATLCYKSLTDPHHPGNYTRAGLEPLFRPHDGKFRDNDQVHPNTKAFFGSTAAGGDEDVRRRDAWKWENCMHDERRFRGTSLCNPCFDIHYNARLEGRNFAPSAQLPYALIVTVKAKNIGDLYNQVVRKYATVLEALSPVIEIPLRT